MLLIYILIICIVQINKILNYFRVEVPKNFELYILSIMKA